MNKYEQCFLTFQGDQGKLKQPNYCIEGYSFNSKTDERLDSPSAKTGLLGMAVVLNLFPANDVGAVALNEGRWLNCQ